MTIYLLVPVLIVLIAVSAWFRHVANNKRTEALQTQAQAMGLQFNSDGSEARDHLADFKLMNIGQSRKAMNLISGDAGDVKISIFDYTYTTGQGKNRGIKVQTVVALESAAIEAPAFSMRQQIGFFDKIGKLFGGQDIDFDHHPRFSELFVLQGPNEEAIRRFFTPTLLTFFETKVGHSIEGGHGKMILYKSDERTNPEEIKDLLASAYEVYGHIVDGD